MNLVLGIDAGGTYTDCVVVDADGSQVLHKAKTLTTKHDLTQCLQACITGVPADLLGRITMACLSTTLATNAIVEGHGCRVGLVLIGSTPSGKLPTPRPVLVKGKFDIKGRLVENIDPAQVREAVDALRGQVDVVAVSGYASVRCPEHELFVKAVIEDRLDLPVVCAHELTPRLGYYDRTVTAVLNAKLIPLVCHLMDSAREVLTKRGVDAPLMLVRGDGTLMAESWARSKPIETILSGPAASAIGAVHLSGRSDSFVVDIGGTTTDVVNVTNGRLVLRPDGATVGGWTTHVRAAEVFTVGLGGDSRIYLDGQKRLQVGPTKSVSYALAGARYPQLIDDLERMWSERLHLGFRNTDQEAFVLVATDERLPYSSDERLITDVLRSGPRTLQHLDRTLKMTGLRQVLGELITWGVIERISLTPTDLWHVTGEFRAWDVRAAELALQISAEQWGGTSHVFSEHVQRAIRDRLELAAVRAATYVDRQDLDLTEGGAADYFLNRLCFTPTSTTLRANYHLLKPVVGIGAPAATWLAEDRAGSLLQAEVPEHAEVANAIGAAVAHAVESVEVLIRHETVTGKFIAFSPMGRLACETLDEATAQAIRSGADFILGLAGDTPPSIESRVEDFEIASLEHGRKLLVERVVHVTARFTEPRPAAYPTSGGVHHA